MKKCTRCLDVKDVEEFNKTSYIRKSDGQRGLRSTCKYCDSIKKRESYERNKERYQKEYFKKKADNPEELRKVWGEGHYRNKEKRNNRQREYHRRNPAKERNKDEEARKKHNARRAVYKAVKNGRLAKPSKCSMCEKQGYVEGHHPDYSKSLEVIWVCRRCHAKIHINEDTHHLNEGHES